MHFLKLGAKGYGLYIQESEFCHIPFSWFPYLVMACGHSPLFSPLASLHFLLSLLNWHGFDGISHFLSNYLELCKLPGIYVYLKILGELWVGVFKIDLNRKPIQIKKSKIDQNWNKSILIGPYFMKIDRFGSVQFFVLISKTKPIIYYTLIVMYIYEIYYLLYVTYPYLYLYKYTWFLFKPFIICLTY